MRLIPELGLVFLTTNAFDSSMGEDGGDESRGRNQNQQEEQNHLQQAPHRNVSSDEITFGSIN